MSIDWFTLVAQIVNFVILIVLLNHFLYRPIVDAIAERESEFQNKLRQARQKESEANEERQKYEQLNEDIENRRQLLLDQIQEETESAKTHLMQEARNEVQFRREDWLAGLDRENESVVMQLVQRSTDHVLAISSKALQQLAGEPVETRILENFLMELRNLSRPEIERLQNEAHLNRQARIETAFPVSGEWQKRIRQTLKQHVQLNDAEFIVEPEVVMGINLRVGGLKTGWSVREYLDSLRLELGKVMDRE